MTTHVVGAKSCKSLGASNVYSLPYLNSAFFMFERPKWANAGSAVALEGKG